MDAWLEYQRVYNNNIRRAREYEERRNWDRYHNLLQILNETHTCPYDHLSGNTRGRAHLREDVVRARVRNHEKNSALFSCTINSALFLHYCTIHSQ